MQDCIDSICSILSEVPKITSSEDPLNIWTKGYVVALSDGYSERLNLANSLLEKIVTMSVKYIESWCHDYDLVVPKLPVRYLVKIL